MDAEGKCELRLKELETLFLNGPIRSSGALSIETLLDILIVVFDECANSSLRREKTISDFISFGKRFHLSHKLRVQSAIFLF